MTPLEVTWPVRPSGKRSGLHFPACIRTRSLYRRPSFHPTSHPSLGFALLRESEVMAQAVAAEVESPGYLSPGLCGSPRLWSVLGQHGVRDPRLIQTVICVKLEPLRVVRLELLKESCGCEIPPGIKMLFHVAIVNSR